MILNSSELMSFSLDIKINVQCSFGNSQTEISSVYEKLWVYQILHALEDIMGQLELKDCYKKKLQIDYF